MQPVFVGDVQGCADELDELIGLAEDRAGRDCELWFVGDLVNRGPHNLRVLRRVRELRERGRARVVLGNHDLALVLSALGLRRLGASDTLEEVLESPDLSEWVEWVRRIPLVETGTLGARRFAMVHAAAHPDWSLRELEARARRVEARLGAPALEQAQQLLRADRRSDPDRDVLDFLLRCRSIDARGEWSDAEPARPEDAWHRRWSARGHAYGVVYGHWSLQGLHVEAGLRGLDTGCVHHGRGRSGYLTAWLPDLAAPDPFGAPDAGFLRVQARRRYYREVSRAPC